MHPVPINQFKQRLKIANNYQDILRIFYGDYLSNESIDNIIASNSLRHMSAASARFGAEHPAETPPPSSSDQQYTRTEGRSLLLLFISIYLFIIYLFFIFPVALKGLRHVASK